MIIGIDAGHGGSNTGTTSGGLVEKDVTLRIAYCLADMLNGAFVNYDDGLEHEVMLIRECDDTLSIGLRGDTADGCDLVISLHVNELLSSPATKGMMVFHWDGNERTKALAHRICQCSPIGMKHSNPVWPAKKTDWTSRTYNVLSMHKADAVLIEMGFASNKSDAEALRSGDRDMEICAAILSGIAYYLR
jgi:N-acetylmuramoyl-L-alanine amidase